jgi:hypothetical protein
MKDKRLEDLSDKVRKGEPIGMLQALEVIQYQEQLKKEREKQGGFFKRILNKLYNLIP